LTDENLMRLIEQQRWGRGSVGAHSGGPPDAIVRVVVRGNTGVENDSSGTVAGSRRFGDAASDRQQQHHREEPSTHPVTFNQAQQQLLHGGATLASGAELTPREQLVAGATRLDIVNPSVKLVPRDAMVAKVGGVFGL
jgi:hypothetical protein